MKTCNGTAAFSLSARFKIQHLVIPATLKEDSVAFLSLISSVQPSTEHVKIQAALVQLLESRDSGKSFRLSPSSDLSSSNAPIHVQSPYLQAGCL